MFVTGQVPGFRFGETPSDILAMLRAGQSAGAGAGDGGNAGDGQKTDDGAGAGAGGSGAGDGDTGSDGKAFDAARAQALIAKLRDENKAAKDAAKEAADLRARLQAIEDKDKSEGEKAVANLTRTQAELKAAQLEAESLRNKYTGALIGAAIEREAGKLNAIDVETVAALVDRSAIAIDESGAVTGADKAVAALLKAKPFLVGQAGSAGGTVKGNGGTPDGKGGGTSRADLIAQTQKELQQSGAYGRL